MLTVSMRARLRVDTSLRGLTEDIGLLECHGKSRRILRPGVAMCDLQLLEHVEHVENGMG